MDEQGDQRTDRMQTKMAKAVRHASQEAREQAKVEEKKAAKKVMHSITSANRELYQKLLAELPKGDITDRKEGWAIANVLRTGIRAPWCSLSAHTSTPGTLYMSLGNNPGDPFVFCRNAAETLQERGRNEYKYPTPLYIAASAPRQTRLD